MLCVGYLGEMIEERIGPSCHGVEIAYSYDSPGLDGTLGAIRRASALFGARFLVLYGDTFLRVDYADFAARWEASGLPAAMTVLRNEDRWDASNAVLAAGRVTRYDKVHPTPEMTWVDYGLGGLTAPAIDLAGAGVTELPELYATLAERALLFGYEATERFYEIGRAARSPRPTSSCAVSGRKEADGAPAGQPAAVSGRARRHGGEPAEERNRGRRPAVATGRGDRPDPPVQLGDRRLRPPEVAEQLLGTGPDLGELGAGVGLGGRDPGELGLGRRHVEVLHGELAQHRLVLDLARRGRPRRARGRRAAPANRAPRPGSVAPRGSRYSTGPIHPAHRADRPEGGKPVSRSRSGTQTGPAAADSQRARCASTRPRCSCQASSSVRSAATARAKRSGSSATTIAPRSSREIPSAPDHGRHGRHAVLDRLDGLQLHPRPVADGDDDDAHRGVELREALDLADELDRRGGEAPHVRRWVDAGHPHPCPGHPGAHPGRILRANHSRASAFGDSGPADHPATKPRS